MASNPKVKTTIDASTFRMPRGPWRFSSDESDSVEVARSPSDEPIARISTDANASRPSPPSCISTRITECPNRVNAVGVSTTTSPVTQVALVEVKSASTNPRRCPAGVDAGSISIPAPQKITAPNPPTSTSGGDTPRSISNSSSRTRRDARKAAAHSATPAGNAITSNASAHETSSMCPARSTASSRASRSFAATILATANTRYIASTSTCAASRPLTDSGGSRRPKTSRLGALASSATPRRIQNPRENDATGRRLSSSRVGISALQGTFGEAGASG